MTTLFEVAKVAGALVVIGAVLYSQVRYFQRSRLYMESLFLGAKLDGKFPSEDGSPVQ